MADWKLAAPFLVPPMAANKPLGFNGGYIALPSLASTPAAAARSSAWDAESSFGGGAESDITEAISATPGYQCDPGSDVKRAKTWHVKMSLKAQRTTNPIRAIMEKITSQKNKPIPGKPVIPLSLGDPTAFGNLHAPEVLNETVIGLIREAKNNGYGASAGLDAARAAIAKSFSTEHCSYLSTDILIASGCSGALEIAINGLVNEGDNLLVPKPGFPLYQVLAESQGGAVREYNLLPEEGWQADLEQMEALIDHRTKAIVVNNPSNPCGSVFPREHLLGMIAIAERHKLPLIADEIYGEMAFDGFPFHPMAELSPDVPVITVGGLAKQFLIPGWRVGWIMLHDPVDALGELRDGFNRLTQLIVGANTLVQAAVPHVLCPVEGSAEAASLKAADEHYMATLQTNAAFTYERLAKVRGLKPVQPQGAMYVMVQYDTAVLTDIANDAEFVQKLLAEEAVFVLPGTCFGAEHFFRVVFSGPHEKLADAFDRMEAFCARHAAAAAME